MTQAWALDPGHGSFMLGGYAAAGRAGGSLDLSARLSQSWAAYARGQLGLAQNQSGDWVPDYNAIMGVSAHW